MPRHRIETCWRVAGHAVTKVFGHDPKAKPVQRIALQRDGISTTISSKGAIFQDPRIAGHEHSVVLDCLR
ncbi:MAG: hypothetical protein ACI9IV_001583 [Paracoccaceae bacterium]|jgi:hypothetical protein